jgi:hypothetical protein
MNNTIVSNTADEAGGGVAVNDWNEPYLVNSIVWDNQAPLGPEIGLDGWYVKAKLHVSHCDVKGGEALVHLEPGTTLYWEVGNIDADPLFVDPGAHDYHLSWLSPCMNQGVNDGAPGVDFDLEVRPFMGTVDLGADEYTGIHPLEADVFALAEGVGGKVTFSLFGDTQSAGRAYAMLGSVTGTAPGNVLPGNWVTLPLNWDPFTNLVITHMNSPIFTDFAGFLDASGLGHAVFDTQGPLPMGMTGLSFSFAYALSQPWDFVSNPINILVVP